MSEQNPGPVQEKVVLPGSKENESRVKGFFRALWKVLSHNWIMKLVCLVLAVLLWGFIYSQDDTLTRDKVFENVPVTLPEGYEKNLREGSPVIVGWNDKRTVTVRVSVPQKYYDELTVDSFSVYPDIAKLKVSKTGPVETVEVSLISDIDKNKIGNYRIDTDKISVDVDRYVNGVSRPVNVNPVGEPPQDQDIWNVKAAPNEQAKLYGPRSLVDKVYSVDVDVNVGSLTRGWNDRNVTGTNIRLFDENGNDITSEISDPLFSISDSIGVTLLIERVKTLDAPVVLQSGDIKKLADRGLVITNPEKDLRVPVRMNVDYGNYVQVSEKTVYASLDIENIPDISGDGAEQVSIPLVYHDSDLGTIVDSPSDILLTVERIKERPGLAVDVGSTDSAPDGFRIVNATVRDSVTVSGPASVVDRIERIVADTDRNYLKEAEGMQDSFGNIRALDANGEELDASHLKFIPSGKSSPVAYLNVLVEMEKLPGGGEADE